MGNKFGKSKSVGGSASAPNSPLPSSSTQKVDANLTPPLSPIPGIATAIIGDDNDNDNGGVTAGGDSRMPSGRSLEVNTNLSNVTDSMVISERKNSTKLRWQRGLTLAIITVAFALFVQLARMTPDSFNEELLVGAFAITCYQFYAITALSGGDIVASQGRWWRLALSTAAFAVCLSSIFITLVLVLEEYGYISHLPHDWALCGCVLFPIYVCREFWHIVKPKVPPVLIKALPQSGDVMAAKDEIANPRNAPLAANGASIEPDWDKAVNELIACGPSAGASPQKLAHLVALRRLYHVSTAGFFGGRGPSGPLQMTLQDEVTKLVRVAKAEKASEDEDPLTKAASFIEWGAQKIPELVQMDRSDIIMGAAISYININTTTIVKTFIPHTELKAIHLIDRGPANEKCDERAAALKKSVPLLEANEFRLSEALIASESKLESLQSINGFQVVKLDDKDGGGYVTFEGNGRREALVRAFKGTDIKVMVEVRVYGFASEKMATNVSQRVAYTRTCKHVKD